MNPGALAVVSAAKHGGRVDTVLAVPVVEVGKGVEVLLMVVEGRLAGRRLQLEGRRWLAGKWREGGGHVLGVKNECVIDGSDAGTVLALQAGGIARQEGRALDARERRAGRVVAAQRGGVERGEEGALNGHSYGGVGGLCDGESGGAEHFGKRACVAVIGGAAQVEGGVVCEACGVGAELELSRRNEYTDDSEQSASVAQEEQSMPVPEGQTH